jgi:hypothetical protein
MRQYTRLFGGVGVMWLALGCSAAERDWLGDILDGRGNPGHGHAGGGQGGSGTGGSAGGGGFEPCGGSSFVLDDVYAEIATDLARLDAGDRVTARYFTLANEAGVLGCGSALDTSRQALFELVNSLSLEAVLTTPIAVDADETLYRISLRDYQWDRPVEVNGTQFVDAWEALVASSVYAVELVGDDADDAKNDSGTNVPVIPGNAFVAAATSAPVYYGVLGIPEDLDAFILNDLGIDVAQNQRDGELIRAGLDGTGLGTDEFLLERFDIEVRAGYVWQIFSDPAGDAALLEDPLGTPDSQERELLFTLPNGLLAHALADADGQRIDSSDLLLDTLENDFRAKVARSYLQFRNQGMTGSDSLRSLVLSDPGRFSPEDLDSILEIYPDQTSLETQITLDGDFPHLSLDALGGSFYAPDPSAQVASQFDADLGLQTAAGDLFVTPDFLEENLALLAPELAVLDGGSIDRGDFDVFYLESLCILSVVNENTPDPALCD